MDALHAQASAELGARHDEMAVEDLVSDELASDFAWRGRIEAERTQDGPIAWGPGPGPGAGAGAERGPAPQAKHSFFCDKMLGGVMAAFDAVAIVVIGLSLHWAYLGFASPMLVAHAVGSALLACVTVSAFQQVGLYRLEMIAVWPRGGRRMLAAALAAFSMLILAAFLLKISGQFSRVWLTGTFVASLWTIAGMRTGVTAMLGYRARHGRGLRNVAVVAASRQAQALIERATDRERADDRTLGDPLLGQRIAGVYDDRRSRLDVGLPAALLKGDLNALAADVRAGRLHKVVIALPWSADERVGEIFARLKDLPVEIHLASDLVAYRMPQASSRLVAGVPTLEFQRVPFTGWSGLVKWLEDKLFASALLMVFAPVMLACAAAIRLDSPGPVLFRQPRRGFNNAPFVVYKFRTMYHRDGADNRQAARGDRRVTRVGRILRRTSLDELPQLLNVLEGSMSLVGPRPHLEELNQQFERLISGFQGRHKVKPGLTGWAQINGFRGETRSEDAMRARIEHDVFYISRWTLWLDVKIIALSAFKGFVHPNAY
jgi:Undecaprenyl-phosphate glucose phosphotransferase